MTEDDGSKSTVVVHLAGHVHHWLPPGGHITGFWAPLPTRKGRRLVPPDGSCRPCIIYIHRGADDPPVQLRTRGMECSIGRKAKQSQKAITLKKKLLFPLLETWSKMYCFGVVPDRSHGLTSFLPIRR
jgi:hypothetical protein